MSRTDRHLLGAGAAACAVCCAPPLLGLLGIVGAAATVATFVLAGVVFAVVVGVATGLALLARRRPLAGSCEQPGPEDLPDPAIPPAGSASNRHRA